VPPDFEVSEEDPINMTSIYNRTNPCPRCKHPEYKVGKASDGRPRFTCTSCGDSWTSGHSGGKFLETGKRAKIRPGEKKGGLI